MIIYPYIDSDVSEKNNLYRHVNGAWLKNNKIPKDRSTDGTFYEIFTKTEKKVKEIIDECADIENNSDDTKVKIGNLYNSFMDSVSIEKIGKKPLYKYIKDIENLSTYEDIVNYMSQHTLKGFNGFYSIYVSNNPNDPEFNILHIYQSGLGLPDKEYYCEKKFKEIYKKYKKYIETMFQISGIKNPRCKAQKLLEFEHEISVHHWSKESSRDARKTCNIYSFNSIKEKFPYLYLWLNGLNVDKNNLTSINIAQPSFLKNIEKLVVRENFEKIKLLLIANVIRTYAPYLSEDFTLANFNFYSHTLSDVPKMRSRWKRGISIIEKTLGDAVGRIYVENHFPRSSKLEAEKLVHCIIEAYKDSIVNLSWMNQDTKQNALDKLNKFIPKIGYPKKWKDYSELKIVSNNIIENIENIFYFNTKYELSKLGKKIDKLEWFMNPQDINAYYHPSRNEIVFPAAILSPPFFYADNSNIAHNFGAIGAIIGHEIGHGFDDQGSHYDGDGRLKNWWHPEDYKSFQKLTLNLIEQYNKLKPAECPEYSVNGKFTLGENIGDLGGLGIAYKAYKMYLNGKKDKIINNLTGDKRFFYAWASIWRSMIRPKEAINRLTTDPHSPNEFRCNQIVKNIDSFYEAFDVKEGDKMWLSPEERVVIWF